jgi:hypothetical protein
MDLDTELKKRDHRIKEDLRVSGERLHAASSNMRVATVQYLHHCGLDHKSIGAIIGVGAARVGQLLKRRTRHD